MNKLMLAAAIVAAASFTVPASAQVEPYRDYTVSDSVSSVSTIRVNSNMLDYYLEGIRRTWVASNEIAKQLGHIQSYSVYVSDLPASGEFNIMLVVTYANTADLAPNRERYEAFMARWGAENQAMSRQTTTTVYPNLRTITGEYLMRELTFTPRAR